MLEPDSRTDAIAKQVIGAAIEVHTHLGPGYLESVYEEALAFELTIRGISHERQKIIELTYKSQPVGIHRLDFLVADILIVEIKAVSELAPIHQAQVISYLKAMKLKLRLLINFHTSLLKQGIKRVVLTK